MNNKLACISMENRKVRFDESVIVKWIHRQSDLACNNEHCSVWYTKKEYQYFRLAEKNRESFPSHPTTLASTLAQGEQGAANDVRHVVLQAQNVQRKVYGQKHASAYSQWLSDFYKLHSKPYVLAGRMRGLENETMLLDSIQALRIARSIIVSRDNKKNDPTIMSKYPWWFIKDGRTPNTNRNTVMILSTDKNDNENTSKNECWSVQEEDYLPTRTEKSTRGAYRDIRRDVDSTQRWSPTPRKHGEATRDLPLKQMKHSLTPPVLISPKAA